MKTIIIYCPRFAYALSLGVNLQAMLHISYASCSDSGRWGGHPRLLAPPHSLVGQRFNIFTERPLRECHYTITSLIKVHLFAKLLSDCDWRRCQWIGPTISPTWTSISKILRSLETYSREPQMLHSQENCLDTVKFMCFCSAGKMTTSESSQRSRNYRTCFDRYIVTMSKNGEFQATIAIKLSESRSPDSWTNSKTWTTYWLYTMEAVRTFPKQPCSFDL